MTDYDPRGLARAALDRARDNGTHQAPPRREYDDCPPEESAAEPTITAVVRTLASIERRPVRWLWPGYIPFGCVSIIDGDPGLGKSTITLDLAARVSRGWAMPPRSGPCDRTEAADVLVLSAEDDPGTTIRPRVEAAGGNLERVHTLDGIRVRAIAEDGRELPETERPPILPRDLDLIEAIVRERAVGLVVIDPLMAFLDSETDAHKDQHVRLVLHRLSQLAAATEAAVVFVRHLNKYRSADAIYRGGGSIGIIGAARSGLLVARHPEISDTYVLAPTKANLGPMQASLSYTMVPDGDVAKVGWGDVVEITADELVAPRRAEKSPEAEAEKKERREKSDDGAMLAALDRLVDRAKVKKPAKKKAKKGTEHRPTKNQLRVEAHLSGDRATRAIGRLVDEGILEVVKTKIAVGSGVVREVDGYRRTTRTTRTEADSPSGPSGDHHHTDGAP